MYDAVRIATELRRGIFDGMGTFLHLLETVK